ncbi:TNF receptor-associated factor 4-like isoform X2 [Corticium candelabrum]|uniref:TNF receptor-associated factor 4-like isoform X2 n=1 Tax=Corticium candelabrum TaxID=121492 RepID=UPI002E264B0C|nr:TNF receptor-associated factor 4-like isoform X2 [Corticium candelabrum]
MDRRTELYTDHHNECKFQIVECPKDCGNSVRRCEFSHHTTVTCPRLLLTCGSCKEKVESRNMKSPRSCCPKLPIDCTLKCGKKVERRHLKNHASELGDCPNTLLLCVFKDVGCDVTVKRHEMEQHLTTAVVQHQIKQHQMVKALRDKNKTLRDENKQIKESLHFVDSALI